MFFINNIPVYAPFIFKLYVDVVVDKMQVHLKGNTELSTAFYIILVVRNMKGITLIIWTTLKFWGIVKISIHKLKNMGALM